MTRPRLAVIVLTASIVVLGAACAGGAGRTARRTVTRSSTTSSAPLATTTTAASSRVVPIDGLAVGVHTEELVDRARPTPANGAAAGAPTRSMTTTIWYPAAGQAGGAPQRDATPDRARGPFPLVVFAHGFAVTPAAYERLLARWASAGYVVVAPSLPLLNGDAPGGASHADYGAPNIADLEFVVGEALRRAGAPSTTSAGDILSGLVDPARVAVAGHSDGEVLAYALAFEACCHDARVKAAVLLAGNLDNARALPAPTGVPVLHVMADHDQYNVYADAVAFDRAHLAPPRDLLTLVGARHMPPFTDPADPHFDVVARVAVDFLDGALKSRSGAATALAADAATGGVATLDAVP